MSRRKYVVLWVDVSNDHMPPVTVFSASPAAALKRAAKELDAAGHVGYKLREVSLDRRVLPPIQGIPPERAKCLGCNKPLAIHTRDITDTEAGREVVKERHFVGWSAYGEGFHSLRCALKFADAAYRAGFRVTHTV